MTLGRVLYLFYFRPLSTVKHIINVGPIRWAATEIGRMQMRKASNKLESASRQEDEKYYAYFLTGKKYWYQTAFCLYSLQKNTKINIEGVFIDDGSICDKLEKKMLNQFPDSKVIRKEYIETKLDLLLPQSKYPTLRSRRLVYPHLRKLTDIHILDFSDWKLVLDSDMLFFKTPQEITSWLKFPDKLLFLQEDTNAYGYSNALLQKLVQSNTIPEHLNVGIAGLKSSDVDWDLLEYWAKRTIEEEGASYYQEQALTALLAEKSSNYAFLPKEKYKVWPKIEGRIEETLHHYVANSKYDYFVKAWKKIL